MGSDPEADIAEEGRRHVVGWTAQRPLEPQVLQTLVL